MAANGFYSFQPAASQSGATVVSYATPYSSAATFADVTAINYQARPVYSAAPASVLYVTQQPQQVAIAVPVAHTHPHPQPQVQPQVQAQVQPQVHAQPQIQPQASQGGQHPHEPVPPHAQALPSQLQSPQAFVKWGYSGSRGSSSSNLRLLVSAKSVNNVSKNSNVGAASKPKGPSKSELEFYCELCRVTCASSQTFEEHRRGSKHRKRQLQLSNSSQEQEGGQVSSKFKCELCDVACTGEEAFKAHMKGSKHQKVIRLHQKLGKPLPSQNGSGQSAPGSTSQTGEEVRQKEKAKSVKIIGPALPPSGETNGASVFAERPQAGNYSSSPKDESVLGASFIGEENNGKLFVCKLCDCSFNDVNGKETHMKGKRHRMNYKRKVDPSISVVQNSEAKKPKPGTSIRSKAGSNDIDFSRIYEDSNQLPRVPPMTQQNLSSMPPSMQTSADWHAMAKHSSIYPSPSRLHTIECLVTRVEHALKLLSDDMIVHTHESQERVLKGVHRVGFLAKGLLLQSDAQLKMIVMCAQKPTYKLLESVANALPKHLSSFDQEHKYLVTKVPQQGGVHVIVHVLNEGPITLLVSLTSILSRCKDEPKDVLDAEHCANALKELRRAKWFEARATGIPSCVIVLRILRDFCQRNPEPWSHVPFYVLELIVTKVLSSSTTPLHPGIALRSIFEALATGLLFDEHLPLIDPCEANKQDVTASVSLQLKFQLMASAQHALRLIVFRRIHTVLDMQPLPSRRTLRAKRGRQDNCEEREEEGFKKS